MPGLGGSFREAFGYPSLWMQDVQLGGNRLLTNVNALTTRVYRTFVLHTPNLQAFVRPILTIGAMKRGKILARCPPAWGLRD
jgi:hypothetical protein